MKNSDNNIAHWMYLAEEHWREFCPKYHSELIEEGGLQSALENAARSTAKDMETHISAGMYEYEAWEIVRERYLLITPEESDESEDTVYGSNEQLDDMYRSFIETNNAINKALDDED